MKKLLLHFGFLFSALLFVTSCGDSTGDLVGLPGSINNPGMPSKVLKKLTTEEGGTSYDINYLYSSGKLTSVTSSDNSISYALEYNGSLISKITRTVIEGTTTEVIVSNLTYTGTTLTEVNGSRSEAGVQTNSFKTTFTYAGGLPTQAKTEMYMPGTTLLLSTLTSDLQYAGNNLASWVFKIQVVNSPPVIVPDIIVTTNFSNYDSNPNPFHTLPLAFTLANCNFEFETSGPLGISVNNFKNISVTSNAGTETETGTYTYDSDGYPTQFNTPSVVLKFQY